MYKELTNANYEIDNLKIGVKILNNEISEKNEI
jgi:hypothetical protein